MKNKIELKIIKSIDEFDKHYDEVGFEEKELSLPEQHHTGFWYVTTYDNNISNQLIDDGFCCKLT